MTSLRREQFQGAILGLAIGDAIGSAWEGLPAGVIYEVGPADQIVKHAKGETIFYTDDTQMMIGIVQTLIEHGRIEKHALAKKFAENYGSDRGHGQGARRILNAIGLGEDWESLASSIFDGQGSLGNGAAMRVGPLGPFFAPDLTKVIAEAALSASPTHCHEIGSDGARLLAAAATLAAASFATQFDRQGFLKKLLSLAQTEEFQWQLNHALLLKPFESLVAFGNTLEAHRSVMTSIICFADSPDSYTEAISRAIGQGGDVDTLAAMAGTLSGARLGISGIPSNLIACLEDNQQGRAFLFDLADGLWEKHLQLRHRDP